MTVTHQQEEKWKRSVTVLPQRSWGSTSAPRWSNKSTTSVRRWQAATWRAVRPSMSLKFTSLPPSNSSSIPSMSPSFARYINRTVGSNVSVPDPAAAAESSLSGASEDCLPSENRVWSFLVSIENAKRNRERNLIVLQWGVGNEGFGLWREEDSKIKEK